MSWFDEDKVKFTLYQDLKVQSSSRDIALLSLTSALVRGQWSAPLPSRFTPGNDPVPIVQEAGLAPGPVWMGAENLPTVGFEPQTVQSVWNRCTN
jgi:hypothetical protein